MVGLDYLHNKHYNRLSNLNVSFTTINNNGYRSIYSLFRYIDFFDFLNNDITKIKNYRDKYKKGEYCPDSLPNESTFSLQDSSGNINIESQKILEFSHKIISGALDVYNNEIWSLIADQVNSSTNNAGHNCGPGEFHASLDSDQVYYLEDLLHDVRNVFVPESQKFVNNYNNSFFVNLIKNYVSKKIYNYENQIKPLTEYYNNVIADLNHQISILNNVLMDATENNNILSDNSNILASNLNLNKDYSNYLQTRIDKPKSISTNNYEELYKAVILQNDRVQDTIDEVNNEIYLDEKNSGFISEKTSFIYSVYLKVFLFYYILIFVFIIFLTFIQKEWVYYKKIAIVILSIIFPPLLFFTETFIYNIWLYVSSMFSSSIYTYTELSQ
uniref:Uncharacterized protein n=1 Tax=viral metagenome TaxID=1070528 RepID=A0A6C0HSQ5_9ZZZZ